MMFTKPPIAHRFGLICILSALLITGDFTPNCSAQSPQTTVKTRPELVLQIGHRSFIHYVALSPDGKTAASLSEDGTLKIWDAQTGDLLDTVALPNGQEIGFSPEKLLFSADGQTIEFLYRVIERAENTTKQFEYRIKTREFRQRPTASMSICPDQAELVAIAPDGKAAICKQSIITEGRAGGIPMRSDEFFLWEPQTKQKSPITKENQWFDTVAFQFSPDGRTIAIYSGRVTLGVVFWDVATRRVNRHFENVWFEGFSADGETIVLQTPDADRCACQEGDKLPLSDKAKFDAVELWDMQLKAAKRTLIGREFFGYTPDGQTILLTKKAKTGTAPTATIELWDAQLRTLKQTLTGNLPDFSPPLYSPDGRMMALPSETNLASETEREEIILYDLQAGKIISRLPTGFTSGFGERMAFSQDGAKLATLSWSGEAKLWDAHTGALKVEIKPPKQKPQKPAKTASESSAADLPVRWPVKDIVFSADGQMIIGGADSGIITIWNFRTGRAIETVGLPSDNSSPGFFAVGETLIQTEPNLPPLAWDIQTLQPRPLPSDGSEKLREESPVTFSPDKRLSVKLSDDRKSATLYDAQTGKQLHALNGHTGPISAVLFAPDNRTVATVSGFPSLDGLSKNALALTAVFAADKKSELEAELNKLIGDRTIKLWDARTGQIKQTLQCEGVIHQARFLPDSATIIATHSNAIKSEDLTEANSFTVWDAQTGKAVRTIKADPQASFLLLPDGALAISRGTEEVKAWDTRTGELKWKNSEVRVSIFDDAPFTPDGKLLVADTKYLDLNTAVKLLDAQTGQVRWSLPGGGLTWFSRDGQTLACLNAAQVSFWDLGTGKLKWSIATPKTLSPQVPFLANGNLIAVYGQHYAIELRDARDGKLLVSLLALPGIGHANEKGETTAEWIAFTPEGYYSASPGAARYIRWRVGDKLLPAEAYAKEFNRPHLVQKAMRNEK